MGTLPPIALQKFALLNVPFLTTVARQMQAEPSKGSCFHGDKLSLKKV